MVNQSEQTTKKTPPTKQAPSGMVGAFTATRQANNTQVTAEMIRRLVHKLEGKEG